MTDTEKIDAVTRKLTGFQEGDPVYVTTENGTRKDAVIGPRHPMHAEGWYICRIRNGFGAGIGFHEDEISPRNDIPLR